MHLCKKCADDAGYVNLSEGYVNMTYLTPELLNKITYDVIEQEKLRQDEAVSLKNWFNNWRADFFRNRREYSPKTIKGMAINTARSIKGGHRINRVSESKQFVSAVLTGKSDDALKTLSRMLARRASVALHEIQVQTAKTLQESIFDDSVEELATRIKDAFDQAKKEGTTSMSKANLKQLVSTRGLRFANPNVFNRAFDDAIQRLKTEPGFKKFIIEAAQPQPYCPKCESFVRDDGGKCPHCGTALQQKKRSEVAHTAYKNLGLKEEDEHTKWKVCVYVEGARKPVREFRGYKSEAEANSRADALREHEKGKSTVKFRVERDRGLTEAWSPEARAAAAKARENASQATHTAIAASKKAGVDLPKHEEFMSAGHGKAAAAHHHFAQHHRKMADYHTKQQRENRMGGRPANHHAHQQQYLLHRDATKAHEYARKMHNDAPIVHKAIHEDWDFEPNAIKNFVSGRGGTGDIRSGSTVKLIGGSYTVLGTSGNQTRIKTGQTGKVVRSFFDKGSGKYWYVVDFGEYERAKVREDHLKLVGSNGGGSFRRFNESVVVVEEWSEEARKAAAEARKGQHPSYQQGHKDYNSNNREQARDLRHQSRQRNNTFSKMYEKHVRAKGSIPEKVEAGSHYRKGWNDANKTHIDDVKREWESAESASRKE